jgi:L-malate glycosyltransferase
VIHNGVDTHRFRPGPVDAGVRAGLGGIDGAALIGIIGRVDPEKGIDVLVEAVAALDDDLAGTRLAVVGAPFTGGEDAARALMDDAVRRLGDRVRFVPPRADVVPVLRALDVLVNASRAEPFGLTVLEAQAAGVPVVATRAGGIPEFVEHGRTGLLVEPGEPSAMAVALGELLRSPALSRDLVTRARASAEAAYGLEVQADRFADLYRRLAGHSLAAGDRNVAC